MGLSRGGNDRFVTATKEGDRVSRMKCLRRQRDSFLLESDPKYNRWMHCHHMISTFAWLIGPRGKRLDERSSRDHRCSSLFPMTIESAPSGLCKSSRRTFIPTEWCHLWKATKERKHFWLLSNKTTCKCLWTLIFVAFDVAISLWVDFCISVAC